MVVLSFLYPALMPPVMAGPCQTIRVCFTPGGDCTAQLVKTLSYAKKSILVQAYSFSSVPIIRSLIEAKKRGVDVKVILDKSQRTQRYNPITLLMKQRIPTWIDQKPAIAHNKVMIIDGKKIVTGSFNFTKAAQERNAENLLIITDPALAQLYTDNWHRRLKESTLLSSVLKVGITSHNAHINPHYLTTDKGFIEICKRFVKKLFQIKVYP